MKFRPKFFWKWSFFDQNKQPLESVEPFERILRALFISQCPYKFSSVLDLRSTFNWFRLFSRDFRLFLFFFLTAACNWQDQHEPPRISDSGSAGRGNSTYCSTQCQQDRHEPARVSDSESASPGESRHCSTPCWQDRHGPVGNRGQTPNHDAKNGEICWWTGGTRRGKISDHLYRDRGWQASSSRREEFEEAGKILDDYSDRSVITSIVKDNPPRKEMRRVRQQVRQCLKEVINNLDYRPTTSELQHWHTHNPGTFNHYKNMRDVNKAIRQHLLVINKAIRQHLLVINTHQQKLKIISGVSITDAHTFRCQMQETHVAQSR